MRYLWPWSLIRLIQGRKGFPRVEQHLVGQGDFRDVARRSPATSLNFTPLLWRAPKVFGLLGAPEAPAPYFPEALLALGFPERHQVALGALRTPSP